MWRQAWRELTSSLVMLFVINLDMNFLSGAYFDYDFIFTNFTPNWEEWITQKVQRANVWKSACSCKIASCVSALMSCAGGQCSDQCPVLGGRRRCWGTAADMCQTCQLLLLICYVLSLSVFCCWFGCVSISVENCCNNFFLNWSLEL